MTILNKGFWTMDNPSQTGNTRKQGSGRNQQQGKPPVDAPIADDAGRFTREPAEGGRKAATEPGKTGPNVHTQEDTANGGARGKRVRNH